MPREKIQRKPFLTKEERESRNEAIVAKLREKKPYREISSEFGISIFMVGVIARSNNLGRGRGNRKGTPFHRAHHSKYYQDVLRLRAEDPNISLRAIGRKLGITHQNVAALLKNHIKSDKK